MASRLTVGGSHLQKLSSLAAVHINVAGLDEGFAAIPVATKRGSLWDLLENQLMLGSEASRSDGC